MIVLTTTFYHLGDGVEDGGGVGHAAEAFGSAGQAAGVGAEGAKLQVLPDAGQVVLHDGVVPHTAVHGRGQQDGLVPYRPGLC